MLIGLALSTIAPAMTAQTTEEPVVKENIYATNITPDGKWLGSFGGSASIYNIQEGGDPVFYQECSLGLGNSITLDGMAVGDRNDVAVIMKDGDAEVPMSLRSYWMSAFNGITPDGSRATGYVNNPKVTSDNGMDFTGANEVSLVPFYVDIAADGTVSEVHILPYPEKDFLGLRPQMVTALFISDDGKTILGQVTDSFGRMCDPIVFQEDENGEWSYSQPSKPLFNPDGVVLPPDPYANAPEVPELENFMDPDSYELYDEAVRAYFMGETSEEPDPFDYMTIEQEQEYYAAVEAYQQYFRQIEQQLKEFDEAYVKILTTSVLFSLNEVAMNGKGTQFAISAASYTFETDGLRIYRFDIENGDYELIESDIIDVAPRQILSDGTLVVATGMMDISTSYLLLPGAKEYISIYDYFKETNPEYAEWMQTTIPRKSGLVSVSDDLSTFAGGLLADHFAEINDDMTYFYSYVFTDAKTAAVAAPKAQPVVDSYKVFNLQGVKVMETKDASQLNSLKGLYIINGKKVML